MAITAQNTNQKPGYKQTEVGVIPEEWEVKRLEELGAWKGGGTPSMANASYWIDGTIYWASSGDIKTKILSNSSSMITEIAVKQSSTTLLKKGAILIVTRSGILRKYLPVAKNTVLIAINQDIKALIPNSQVSADYLLQVLSERGPDILSSCMKAGTTVESVEYTWLKKYQIALPPPAEQRAIATALSDVDALITSLDRLIAKRRDIKKATMQQLLTGKTRLPGISKELKPVYKQTEIGMIPEEWDVQSVEEIADVTTGDKDTQDKTESGAYPFFVRSQTVERINSYSHDGEAILTAGDGVGVGKVFHYTNGKFDFHQRVYMICNFRKFDGFFFYLYFSNNFYKEATKYNAKNSVDSVRREIITGMRIPHPPLPEQQAIANILSDIDAEITALEQKRDKTRALKQGMMQELLTGKTRLI